MCDIDAIVYLGPTLEITEAKTIFSEAHYLPPIRCGDILHALRWRPKTIVIIDGYFEKTSSIWHKEILLALEKGIRVYGASSMGALRACELSVFGMIGIGKIYEQYSHGILTDDDEVAVLHQSGIHHYKPITDAMVNIRETLSLAYNSKIINGKLKNELLDATKKTFYQQRRFNNICHEFAKNTHTELGIYKLIEWIKQGNYCNQKRLDAIECLLTVKNQLNDKIYTTSHNTCFSTMYLKTLQRKIACKPYHTFKPWLSLQEKTAQISRLLGKDYCVIKCIAHLSAIVYAIAKKKYIINNSDPIFINIGNLTVPNYDINDDMSNHEISELQIKQRYICKFYYDENSTLTPAIIEVRSNYLNHIINSDNQFYFSYLISVIIEDCLRRELNPSDKELLNVMHKFTKEKKINSKQKFIIWLSENNLNHQDFMEIVKIYFYLDYFIVKNNAYAIEALDENEFIWWLLHALYITNQYQKAKTLLLEQKILKNTIEKIHQLFEREGKKYLYAIDFDQGEQEFEEFICEIQQQYIVGVSKMEKT